ncbi:MAG: hypothetical protein ACK5MP_03235 [Nostocoides sp.]
MRPRPLPGILNETPFSVQDARACGVTPGRLRASDLVIPTYAVRAHRQPETLSEIAQAMALGLPSDAVFSHVTASRLHGIPLPHLVGEDQLDVIRDGDLSRIRRAGCRGHRGLNWRNWDTVDGLRVTALPDTWVDLGEVLPRGLSLDDLVVAGDYVATVIDGADVLRELLGFRVRPRGKRLLSKALREVRWPVRSPMETRTRLLVTRSGAPAPEVNAPVYDRGGEWILEGDLVWRDARVVVEYQGWVHAPISARSRDAHRRALAEASGWQVIEAFADDVLRPAGRGQFVARVLSALGCSRVTDGADAHSATVLSALGCSRV